MMWLEPHNSFLHFDFGIYVLPVGVGLAPPDALVGVLPEIFALVPGVVLLPSATCHCVRFAAIFVALWATTLSPITVCVRFPAFVRLGFTLTDAQRAGESWSRRSTSMLQGLSWAEM